jgi:hypothetical protein
MTKVRTRTKVRTSAIAAAADDGHHDIREAMNRRQMARQMIPRWRWKRCFHCYRSVELEQKGQHQQ